MAVSPTSSIGDTSISPSNHHPWRRNGMRMSHAGSFIASGSGTTVSGIFGRQEEEEELYTTTRPLEKTWGDDVVRIVCISGEEVVSSSSSSSSSSSTGGGGGGGGMSAL